MLNLVVGHVDLGKNYYYGLAASNSVIRSRCLVFKDFSKTSLYSARSPVDFLSQGGEFDRFGNKTVIDCQIDGNLTIMPRINGGSSGDGTVARSSKNVSITQPPSIMIGTTAYNVLNYGDVIATAGYTDTVYLMVCHAAGPSGNQAPIATTLSIRFVRKKSPTGAYKYHGDIVGLADIKSGIGDKISTLHIRLAAKLDFDDLWVNYNEIPQLHERLRVYAPMIIDCMDLARSSHVNKGGQPDYRSTTTITSWENPDFSVSSLIPELKSIRDALSSYKITPEDRSILAGDTIESLNDFSSNMLAYISDLGKTGDTVRSLLKLPRNFKNPRAWAETWLSVRYGDRLMISDTKELLSSLQRKLGTRAAYSLGRTQATYDCPVILRGKSYQITTTVVNTIVSSDKSYNGIMTAIKNLMNWDIWPSTENTWDMIPLSFVVDWVLPVQDVLNQLDDWVEAPYIVPITQYCSEHSFVTVDGPFGPNAEIQGALRGEYYKRLPRGILGDVRPFDVHVDLPSFSVIHAGDALALTTTLKRHR